MKGLTIIEVTPQSPDPEAALFAQFVALVESVKDGATIEIAVRYPPVPQKRREKDAEPSLPLR